MPAVSRATAKLSTLVITEDQQNCAPHHPCPPKPCAEVDVRRSLGEGDINGAQVLVQEIGNSYVTGSERGSGDALGNLESNEQES